MKNWRSCIQLSQLSTLIRSYGVVLLLLLSANTQQTLHAQSGEFHIPQQAIFDFAPVASTDLEAFSSWLTRVGGQSLSLDKDNRWCPAVGQGNNYFVVYRYRLLRLWFGPGTFDWQTTTLQKLEGLIDDPLFASRQSDTRVYPVTFVPGHCLEASRTGKEGPVVINLPVNELKQQNKILKSVEADLKSFEQIRFDPDSFGKRNHDLNDRAAQKQGRAEATAHSGKLNALGSLHSKLLEGGVSDARLANSLSDLRGKYRPGGQWDVTHNGGRDRENFQAGGNSNGAARGNGRATGQSGSLGSGNSGNGSSTGKQ